MLFSSQPMSRLSIPGEAPVQAGPFSLESYEKHVEPSLSILNKPLTMESAEELTLAIFDAIHDTAHINKQAGILLNSSTGKDSTLMVAMYVKNAYFRRKAGKPIIPAIVGISDTGSEFPDMAMRMQDESKALQKFAESSGLPLSVRLVAPPPKNKLLVELIGAGLALPQLKNGPSASGFVGASWCMDRVKAKPLGQILKDAKDEYDFFFQCVGVRSGESAKRSRTVARHGADLPFGLTYLDGDNENRMGVTPIVHWTDELLRQWMTEAYTPWDLLSNDNLRHIYALGSKPNERAGECVLTITKEGAVSNICSDLGGARFGCWMCILSKNKSLHNAAAQDERYVPLRDFHTYLFSHHTRGDARRILRDSAGLRDLTMFPKGFTLLERITMLMRLLRAEIESGYTLLEPEDLTAIQYKWEKHGLLTYTPEDARRDTKAWMENNPEEDPQPFFAAFGDLRETSLHLSEGTPFGAFHHLLHGGRSLELSHLISAAGWGTPIFPTLTAYVFEDKLDYNRTLVMVSDSLSALGGRTNTGLMNGLVGARWTLKGHRAPTDWELELSDGRVVFYEISHDFINQCITDQGNVTVHPLVQVHYENKQVTHSGCPEDVYGAYIMSQHDALTSANQLSYEQFKALGHLIMHLTIISDEITDEALSARHQMQQFIKNREHLLESRDEKGKTDTAKGFRGELRQFVKETLKLPSQLQGMQEYARGIRKLASLCQSTSISPALINRMAYACRMLCVEEEEGTKLLSELKAAPTPDEDQETQSQEIASYA
jgi:3'-phosphoadenosine 5'-phosphosulfate sulfotransferase (PAPS reductase)/FAD synthetase